MADTDDLSSGTDMAHWCCLFKRYLQSEKRASRYTVRNYTTTLERFEDFLVRYTGEAISADVLSRLEIRDFRAFLTQRHEEGLAPPSLKLELSALKSFYRFLNRRAGVENDAIDFMRGPGRRERLPRAVSPDDARKLIGNAGKCAPQTRQWERQRDVALFTLLYGAGLRISEALSLQQKDVPFPEMLKLTGKGGKMRVVPVLPVVREAADVYVRACPYSGRSAGDPLFFSRRGRPFSPTMAQRRMKRIREETGLPRHTTPHALRHAFATHLLAAGGDLRAVQELLGHGSLAATQHYISLDTANLARVFEKAHPHAETGGKEKADTDP